MSRIVLATLLVGLVCSGVAAQEVSWVEGFDQFEEYPVSPLPAPWESDGAIGAYSGIGYEDTAGLRGPGSGWTWGHASRPVGVAPAVGDVLVARVFLPAGMGYRQVRLGLTEGKTPSESGGFADGARAVIHLTSGSRDDPEGRFSYWSFHTHDSEGAALGSATNGAPVDAWYDVRITLHADHTVLAEFKHVEMDYWVPLGWLPVPEGFVPQHVSVASSRGGVVDDIGYMRPAQ